MFDYLEKYKINGFDKGFIEYFGTAIRQGLTDQGINAPKIHINWNRWKIKVAIPIEFLKRNNVLQLLCVKFNADDIKLNVLRSGHKNRSYEIMLIFDKNNGNSKEAMCWHEYHKKYNLPEKLLGDTVGKYTVLGLDPHKNKYPVVVRELGGKRYRMSISMFSRMFNVSSS